MEFFKNSLQEYNLFEIKPKILLTPVFWGLVQDSSGFQIITEKYLFSFIFKK